MARGPREIAAHLARPGLADAGVQIVGMGKVVG
jgi:hypothetical protein